MMRAFRTQTLDESLQPSVQFFCKASLPAAAGAVSSRAQPLTGTRRRRTSAMWAAGGGDGGGGAAAASVVSAGPEALLVCVTRTALGRVTCDVRTLAALLADDAAASHVCHEDVAAAASAERGVPLHGVLLQRAPLPGFGLLPAGWVSPQLRRAALCDAVLADAADAAAVLRLLRAARQHAGGGEPLGLYSARLAYHALRQLVSLLQQQQHGVADADADATHVEALEALRAFPDDAVRGAALLLLGAAAVGRLRRPPPAVAAPLCQELVHAASALDAHAWRLPRVRHDAVIALMRLAGSSAHALSAAMTPRCAAFVAGEADAHLRALCASPADAWTANALEACLLLLRAALHARCTWTEAQGALRVATRTLRLTAAAPPPHVCAAACALLAAVLERCDPATQAAPATNAALAAVVASPAMELSAAALYAAAAAGAPPELHEAVRWHARLWWLLAGRVAAWPGGGAAFAARCDACCVVDALTALATRRHDAGAADLVQALRATLRRLVAALSESSSSGGAQAEAEEAAEREAAAAPPLPDVQAAFAAQRRVAKAQARAWRGATQPEEAPEQRDAPLPAQLPPPPPPLPPLPLPLALPLPLPLPGAPEPPRATDEQLAALFPWMRIDDDVATTAPAPAEEAADGGFGDDDDDDGCCCVCLDAPRDTALLPCGHALLCARCAGAVLAAAAPRCPVCRAHATGCCAAAVA
jgi:hypothetical protein